MMRKGFTLIELMIILVVIGILVAVGLPKFSSFIEEGRASATRQEMSAIKSASKMFEMHMRIMPQMVANLMIDPTGNAQPNYSNGAAWIPGVEVWKGPYMDGDIREVCCDAWGHPYVIYYDTRGPSGFVIFSWGPDSKTGDAVSEKDDIKDWVRYDGNGPGTTPSAAYFTDANIPAAFGTLTPETCKP